MSTFARYLGLFLAIALVAASCGQSQDALTLTEPATEVASEVEIDSTDSEPAADTTTTEVDAQDEASEPDAEDSADEIADEGPTSDASAQESADEDGIDEDGAEEDDADQESAPVLSIDASAAESASETDETTETDETAESEDAELAADTSTSSTTAGSSSTASSSTASSSTSTQPVVAAPSSSSSPIPTSPARAVATSTTLPTIETLPPATTEPPAPLGENESLVATARDGVRFLLSFDEPNGEIVRLPFPVPNPHQFGGPLTLLVTEGSIGDEWVKVQLPVRPNGQEAWIPAKDYDLSVNSIHAEVNLSTTSVKVFDGNELIAETQAGIGTPATPTPLGRFYVASVRTNPSSESYLGSHSLVLSAFSEAHDTFSGGLPVIAIHGTLNPGNDLGRQVSNGCVRVPNEVISFLAQHVPAGTPVTISA